MKKFKIAFLLLPFFCLTACNGTYKKPNNTNLEYWITDRPSRDELNEKGYTVIPGWVGATEYLSPDYEPITEKVTSKGPQYRLPSSYVIYIMSGYPDIKDKYAVTRIEVTDPNVKVFGLTMLSEKSEIDKRMKKLGFKLEESGDYSKGKMFAEINNRRIYVAVSTTNETGIQF